MLKEVGMESQLSVESKVKNNEMLFKFKGEKREKIRWRIFLKK